MQGEADAAPATVPVRLTVPVGPSDNRTTLLTAALARAADGVFEATPTAGQGSHLTGALAASDAFVIAADEQPAGALADALLF